MELKHSIFIFLTLLFFSSCNFYFSVDKEKFTKDGIFIKNFEFAHIIVDSLDAKGHFPVKYVKQEIAICIVSHPYSSKNIFDINNNQKKASDSYTSIDDYWQLQDKADSLIFEIAAPLDKAYKTISFYEKQSFTKWLTFPFSESEVYNRLPIKMENNNWYKISHIGVSLENVLLYLHIDANGKLRMYRKYDYEKS
jgi:hypothetical protein